MHGKYGEADPIQREELAMERALSGADHPFVANSLIQLGELLWYLDRPAEAEAAFHEALVIRQTKVPDADAAITEAQEWFATALTRQGKTAEAEILWRKLLATHQTGPNRGELSQILLGLTATLQKQKKFPEAEEHCRAALAIQREALEPEHFDLAGTLARLTEILLAAQKFAEAEPLAREGLQIYTKHLSNQWGIYRARALMGASLLGQKKYAAAEPLLLSAYAGMKTREEKMPPIAKPYLKEALQQLVQLYEVSRQPDKLAEWKGKLADLDGDGR